MILDWYLKPWQAYATFSGRAQRMEYWTFFFVNFAIFILLGILGTVPGFETAAAIVYLLFLIATFLPSLAVAVRRLHDIGRSGWWVLLAFIPIIGTITLIVMLVFDSQEGENIYGPNPKALTTPADQAVV